MTKPPKKPLAPTIPLVAWRDGRPRFSPSPAARALGYKGEDLRHEDGRWFTAGEALDWSTARAAEISARRGDLIAAANKRRPKGAPPIRHVPKLYTLADLFHEWQQSPRWGEGFVAGKRKHRPYSTNTKNNYRWKMKAIEKHDPDLYSSAVEALDRTIVFGLYEELWEDKGLATARGCIATLSSAISWGLDRGKFRMPSNPAQDISMQTPEVVVRFGSREEVSALVAAADAMGRPEIGDMVTLGVWTGQRQGDRLALVAETHELVRGRRTFHQAKTGAVVAVLQAPELERRLAAARRRRAEAGIASAHVIVNEATGKPWDRFRYNEVFAEVRALAVAGLKVGETPAQAIARGPVEEQSPAKVATLWRLPPCRSVETLWDKHFRATAVVWMALGQSTIPEIISVTGHTAASAHTILRHYLARHPEMADAAIRKMMAWFDSAEESENA